MLFGGLNVQGCFTHILNIHSYWIMCLNVSMRVHFSSHMTKLAQHGNQINLNWLSWKILQIQPNLTYLYSDTILFIFSSYKVLENLGHFLYFRVTRGILGILEVLVGILVILDVLEIFWSIWRFWAYFDHFFNTSGVFWSFFGGGFLMYFVILEVSMLFLVILEV